MGARLRLRADRINPANYRGQSRVIIQAMLTYGQGVREHFLGKLSRPQIAAMGENCRRISISLKETPAATKVGRV